MKKKFDFSTEMAEAEAIKSNPKNESLEEENHLFDINVQELAKLNNNVFKLRTEVENLSGSIRECKPIISSEMQKLAVEFGARLLCDFLSQIESKCKEAERRMKKSGNTILVPVTAFYITSSKSTVSLYEQLAYTCCNYIANPKISIHKQPQLLTAKI